jgi:hypothetical protein
MSRKIGTGQTTKQRLVHSLLLSSPACLLERCMSMLVGACWWLTGVEQAFAVGRRCVSALG